MTTIQIKSLVNPLFSFKWWMSWLSIAFGCALVAAGYVFFISPYNIVPGGVYGAGIVLHNIFPGIKVGTFGYMFDVVLLTVSFFLFGRQFGVKTVFAALLTPGLMNIFTSLSYPNEEAIRTLDSSLMLGGMLDLSGHLMLAAIVGAVIIGVGVGLVVRQQATTGGTDIVAMMLQKYLHINFSKGVLIADSVVVLSGLLVIGFGLGLGEPSADGWTLSFYSLITIYISSRVISYVIEGASYDKLIFIITEKHNEELRKFILYTMDRGGTYIKSTGMYTNEEKEMIFLVISRKEVVTFQRIVKELDPKAFMVVTDAYDTFGEGFKPMPSKEELENL